ncbi:Zn-dependent protease [Bacillus sp. HMF5848]|uniref:DUF2268 domain-containing protein n=1 Tax=Bacillus sp. HMF5848 TaxID=2495421 RepID=UPI000F79BA38|nr:DUF2268 domain-containing putative Zn-dependent protease [Bacillus sp. HMF5848]RSK26464.1 Zn-dependent protease [Bacillus sp. HMF5848]
MTVIATDQWLDKYYFKPVKMCEKLEKYFEDASAEEIYEYLQAHGMYQPYKEGVKVLDYLQSKKAWTVITDHYNYLRKKWKGPEIPIFIFPCNTLNKKMSEEFNGKSGLAFPDKLFLFFSEKNIIEEMKSVLTHEYSHVIRLAKDRSDDLLHTIILEGLAEASVLEEHGEKFQAPWTKYYSEEEAQRYWRRFIQKNVYLNRFDRQHDRLLYGKGLLPRMLGYNIGFHMVKSSIEEKNCHVKDLLSLSNNEILRYSRFDLK